MKLNNTKYNTYAAYALIVITFGLLYAAFIFNIASLTGVRLMFINLESSASISTMPGGKSSDMIPLYRTR